MRNDSSCFLSIQHYCDYILFKLNSEFHNNVKSFLLTEFLIIIYKNINYLINDNNFNYFKDVSATPMQCQTNELQIVLPFFLIKE